MTRLALGLSQRSEPAVGYTRGRVECLGGRDVLGRLVSARECVQCDAAGRAAVRLVVLNDVGARQRPKTGANKRGRASAVRAAPATVAHRDDSRTADAIEALLDRSTTGRATQRWVSIRQWVTPARRALAHHPADTWLVPRGPTQADPASPRSELHEQPRAPSFESRPRPGQAHNLARRRRPLRPRRHLPGRLWLRARGASSTGAAEARRPPYLPAGARWRTDSAVRTLPRHRCGRRSIGIRLLNHPTHRSGISSEVWRGTRLAQSRRCRRRLRPPDWSARAIAELASPFV